MGRSLFLDTHGGHGGGRPRKGGTVAMRLDYYVGRVADAALSLDGETPRDEAWPPHMMEALYRAMDDYREAVRAALVIHEEE